jgi:AraC-like DNA-binding protein
MELIRSYSVTHPAGIVRLPQTPDWDQVIYASRGTVRLTTEASTWVLPSLRAAWVPAGVDHRCRVTAGTRMRTLYVHRSVGLLAAETIVVDLTRFARELVTHLVATAPWVADDPLTSSYLDVLRSVLQAANVVPLALPWPSGDAAALVAGLLEADPGSQQSVAELARSVGVSRRTLERRFVDSVGMTVGQWRQQLRLVVGLERLAEGRPVGRVAVDLGYSTQSAFGAMFKAHLGCSPGTYFTASRG